MKLDKSRKSKNVEDRSRDTSTTAFKTDPDKNPALLRIKQQREKEYTDYGEKVIKQTMSDKNNPFRKTLKHMDKPQSEPHPNSDIPIPTARPDPSVPYKRPKIFTNLTGYNSQVTPGEWKEKK